MMLMVKPIRIFTTCNWGRIWIDAKLEDGYYFSTKISADGPGNHIGVFGATPYDGDGGYSDGSVISGGRAALRFAELHFGRKTDKYGYSMGILPMSGLGNPEYDLHFYPYSTSDIPYHIINTSTAAGFRGYYKLGENKVNITLSVDDNTGNREIDGSPRDQYSLFANYEMKFGEIGVAPTLIFTTADEDLASPMTLGANATLPKVAGIAFSAGGYFTNQSVEAAGKYSGIMAHVKGTKNVGPGALASWVDYKTINTDGLDDNTNTTCLWISYKYTLHKSEDGNLTITPGYRRIMQNTGDVEYARKQN